MYLLPLPKTTQAALNLHHFSGEKQCWEDKETRLMNAEGADGLIPFHQCIDQSEVFNRICRIIRLPPHTTRGTDSVLAAKEEAHWTVHGDPSSSFAHTSTAIFVTDRSQPGCPDCWSLTVENIFGQFLCQKDKKCWCWVCTKVRLFMFRISSCNLRFSSYFRCSFCFLFNLFPQT